MARAPPQGASAMHVSAPPTARFVGERRSRVELSRRNARRTGRASSVTVRAEGCVVVGPPLSLRTGLTAQPNRCPFCRDVGKCISICRNPQNTGLPEAEPSIEQTAPGAVCVQLDALAANNTPRVNHGIQVMYYFCADASPMERSRFFGEHSVLTLVLLPQTADALCCSFISQENQKTSSNSTTSCLPGSNSIAIFWISRSMTS